MKRHQWFLAVAILGLVATACLRQDLDAGVIVRQSEGPTATATPVSPGVYTVGQSAATARGNTVTVYAFEPGLPSNRSGIVIAGADVETCTARTAAPQTRVDPRSFEIEFSDQTRRPSVTNGPKTPRLEPQILGPGRCARGWVHFEYRADETPAAVVLQSTPPLRWKVV